MNGSELFIQADLMCCTVASHSYRKQLFDYSISVWVLTCEM